VSDEQRVRTMAGWIGVEISKSRVRTPGKAGYGLYRVRGSVATGQVKIGNGTLYAFQETEWTAYAFTLEEIERAVGDAISRGTPAGPGELVIESAATDVRLTGVPTRWTSAYRGSRTLGVGEAEKVGTAALGAQLETDTVRARQRAHNAEFQAEHKARRDWGLKQRHARKTAHNARRNNDAG
jgi:hypothetical protein